MQDLKVQARQLQQTGKTADALALWQRLLRTEPDNIEALHMAGICCQQSGLTQDALNLLTKARQLDGQDPYIAYNLALSLTLDRQHDMALPLAQEAASKLPNQAGVFLTLGNIQMALNHTHEAIISYDKALTLQPAYPEARYNRSLCHLLNGDFSRGWPDWEYRWQSPAFTSPIRDFDCPQWQGEDVTGKRVHIHAEQGLGDCVQMMRYIPAIKARGASPSLEVNPALTNLVQDTCPEYPVIPWGAALSDKPDFHVPMMSLPGLLNSETGIVPKPWNPGAMSNTPSPSETGTTKIGLVWAGNPHHPRDIDRSMPLSCLDDLRNIAGLDLYSFQVGPAAWDVRRRKWRDHVTDLSENLTEFTKTRDWLMKMDLVITIDSVVAHLAASMNLPVWLLVSHAPDWRWMLDRVDSPWYPSITLFRQKEAGNWHHPIQQILSRLENRE